MISRKLDDSEEQQEVEDIICEKTSLTNKTPKKRTLERVSTIQQNRINSNKKQRKMPQFELSLNTDDMLMFLLTMPCIDEAWGVQELILV